MKRFEFRLQTVLDVRRVREDRLRTELAALCYQEQQQERRLSDLRRQYLQVHENIVGAGGSLSGTQVLTAWNAGERLTLAIDTTDLQRRELEQQRQGKQQEAQTAASQRKMLERLQEKALGRYLTEAATAAERQSDDLCALSRAVH